MPAATVATFGKASNLKTDMAAKIAGTLFMLPILFFTIPALIVRESMEAASAFGALMGAFCAGAFLVVVAVKSLKEKLANGPQGKKRKELINLWRLHEIGKGRMDWRTAVKIVPSNTDLDALLAEMKHDAETAASRTSASFFAPPAPAAMRKLKPVPEMFDTLRIVFQDGEEIDIRSDWGFVRLDEEEFNIAYKAFEKSRAEIYGLPKPPELNSKLQRDVDRMWDQRGDAKDESSK